MSKGHKDKGLSCKMRIIDIVNGQLTSSTVGCLLKHPVVSLNNQSNGCQIVKLQPIFSGTYEATCFFYINIKAD